MRAAALCRVALLCATAEAGLLQSIVAAAGGRPKNNAAFYGPGTGGDLELITELEAGSFATMKSGKQEWIVEFYAPCAAPSLPPHPHAALGARRRAGRPPLSLRPRCRAQLVPALPALQARVRQGCQPYLPSLMLRRHCRE